jgi:hypothetical protein
LQAIVAIIGRQEGQSGALACRFIGTRMSIK